MQTGISHSYGVQKYWNEIPPNTLKQMGGIFALSFVIRTIATNDFRLGLIGGCLSVTATAIYGLVTPLFKRYSKTSYLSWQGEMCRTLAAIIGAGLIGQYVFRDRSILRNISISGIIYGILTYLDPNRRNLNQTNWVIPIS